jgi:hypothetical protein
MTVTNALASVAVDELDRARAFYEMLLGAPTQPMPDVLEWWLPGGGALQVYRLAERAGGCSCTLLVTDIGESVERLRPHHPIEPSGVVRGDRMDVLMIRDPDGNSIALVEPRRPGDASGVVPHTTPTSADGPPERTPFA